MAIDSNGILHIDYDNETFDEILDNVATVLMDYRVTTDPGQAARDVGILCTSPNINKWAKRKPLCFDVPVIPNDGSDIQKAWEAGADMWGHLGGMTSSFSRYNAPEIVNWLMGSSFMMFEYQRPYDYWKRLGDFDKYQHVPDYGRTGSVPFFVGFEIESNDVEGIISMYLILGNSGNDYRIEPMDFLNELGGHVGLLLVRPHINDLYGQFVLDNKDYLVITTEKPIKDYNYPITEVSESNGLVSITRTAYDTIQIKFKLPSSRELTNTDASFAGLEGQSISFYPIIANDHIVYADVTDQTDYDRYEAMKITKLAPTNQHWVRQSMNLAAADPNRYIAPNIYLEYELSFASGQVVMSNIGAYIATAHSNNAQYRIHVDAIDYTLQYYDGLDYNGNEVWKNDVGEETHIGWTDLVTLGPNSSQFINRLDNYSISPEHTSTKYRVLTNCRGHVEYNAVRYEISSPINEQIIIK